MIMPDMRYDNAIMIRRDMIRCDIIGHDTIRLGRIGRYVKI